MSSSSDVQKALGLPEDIDPTHSYSFRSNEYGALYQYWYVDRFENYWSYSNAPKDHPHHDPYSGEPTLDQDQPLPQTHPQYFTQEGYKRHIGVPFDVDLIVNERYDKSSKENLWFEKFFTPTGEARYVYLDKDTKENLYLYVQNQIRVASAGINKLRSFSAALFRSPHPRDKAMAMILMLVDQAYFPLVTLTSASVADVSFTNKTVSIAGRSFACDEALYDMLTSITVGRDTFEPLFVLDGFHGKTPLSYRMLSGTFAYLKVSPKFLLAWHASRVYSSIVTRLYLDSVDVEDAEALANEELIRAFNLSSDIVYYVDPKVKSTLEKNYKSKTLQKSIDAISVGVPVVYSDLVEHRYDELEFSKWLHNTPMHNESEQQKEQ